MWQNSINNQRGFTLLEVIVAIAIFAMLGLASATVMQTVLKNNEVTAEFEKRLKSQQSGMMMIERDFSQMVARTSRGDIEHGKQVMIQANNTLDSDSQVLIFYRLGWSNAAGMFARGTIQQVAYRVREEKLERLHYNYPDPIVGEEPSVIELMDGVMDVSYAFFVDGSWQDKNSGEKLPLAVAMEIELINNQKIVRKFLLPEAKLSAEQDNSGLVQQDSNSAPNNQNNEEGTEQGQPTNPNNNGANNAS